MGGVHRGGTCQGFYRDSVEKLPYPGVMKAVQRTLCSSNALSRM